jgi:hypothetical protein
VACGHQSYARDVEVEPDTAHQSYARQSCDRDTDSVACGHQSYA